MKVKINIFDELCKYGKVELFEVGESEIHIKLTEGFSTNAASTFELIELIYNCFPAYNIVKRLVKRENMFDHILIKPQKLNLNL